MLCNLLMSLGIKLKVWRFVGVVRLRGVKLGLKIGW